MQHTPDIVKNHGLAGPAVSAFRIRQHREAVGIHTGAGDQSPFPFYHMQALSQSHINCILEHDTCAAAIRCLKQPHDQAFFQFSAIQSRTESCQVVDHRDA